MRAIWSSLIISLATGPVFVSSLKFEVKEMMHQLPPLPYDDPNGILTDFRQHILEKVHKFFQQTKPSVFLTRILIETIREFWMNSTAIQTRIHMKCL